MLSHVLLLLLLLQAPLSATTTNGLPSLSVTLTDITSKVTQVADNDGHPELAEFVKQRTAGPAQLQIAFVPNARGNGAHASNFVISSGQKLLCGLACFWPFQWHLGVPPAS